MKLAPRGRWPIGRRPQVCLLIAIALTSSCHSNSTTHDGVGEAVVVDQGGEGALVYEPGVTWGVNKGIVRVGETWSAGSVTLCKKSADERVTLQRIQAVSVSGQVRLDGIGVRTTHYAKPNGPSDPDNHLVGTMPGVPSGLASPHGFDVVTTCPDSRVPVGEIVVTLTKLGQGGGSLDGLRISYVAQGETHELTLHFHFGLCGTGIDAVPCESQAG